MPCWAKRAPGARRHDAREIVARESHGAVVGAGGEDQRARSHDDGFVLSNDENFPLVDAGDRCSAVKMQARKIRDPLASRSE